LSFDQEQQQQPKTLKGDLDEKINMRHGFA